MIAPWLSSSWTGLGAEIGNHVWQSTLFAAAAWLLTLALRRNSARVRYWVWLAASLKFLIPFSLLIALGASLAPQRAAVAGNPGMYLAMEKVSLPFALPTVGTVTPMASAVAPGAIAGLAFEQTLMNLLPALIGFVWLCGFAAVFAVWVARWRRVAAMKREAIPLREGREIEILRRLEREVGMRKRMPVFLADGTLEPGIFGMFRPVLLWPEGISANLDDAQVEAILQHELSHARRRDNLAAALHLLVEAVFWFYPVVWWLGARLIDEREQACDEDVVQRGKGPQAYAEGILKICQFCVEAPRCVAGVSGADLKQRIRRIVNHRAVRNLGAHKKLLLTAMAAAVVFAPLAFGVIGAPQDQASTDTQAIPTFGPEFKYAVASIKPDKAPAPIYSGWTRLQVQPDGFRRRNTTAYGLFQMAYLRAFGPFGQGVQGYRDDEIFGAPDWFRSDRYDVDARIEGPAIEELQKLSPQQRLVARAQMLRALLEERFALRVHTETREIPVYIMTVANGGPKFKESTPGETFPNEEELLARLKRLGFPPEFPFGYSREIGESQPGVSAVRYWMTPMVTLTGFFGAYLDHQVVDRTGLTGKYDFTLRWSYSTGTEASGAGTVNSGPAFAASTPPDAPPLSFKTVEKQLGLKLKAGKARMPVIVIDHVEKPSEN